MKKLLFSALIFSGMGLMAQDTSNELTSTSNQEFEQEERIKQEMPFNKWSIEFGAGVHKPSRPFADNYFANTPSLYQADLGVRYMINRDFGFGLEGGYGSVENDEDSNPFETKIYRINLEAYVNVGNLMGFKQWTNSFGLLMHGGAGTTLLEFDGENAIEDATEEVDNMLNVTVGVTPQLKLSNSFALFADLSIFGHVRQEFTWDGTERRTTRDFDGFLTNASIGLSIYLGDKVTHADWYYEPENAGMEELEERIATLETNNADDDQDGVPNYLDRDNTTESGVNVDRKGRAIDLNKNGIPDDMESALDQLYAQKEAVDAAKQTDNTAMMKQLINGGYINVYFETNSTRPTSYSVSSINFLKTYLKDNPEATASLSGYADETGDAEYNKQLSERRAKMVRDILVATGISEDRLTYEGQGEDTSVEVGNAPARATVRRVRVQLND